jgi:hypothetical protein
MDDQAGTQQKKEETKCAYCWEPIEPSDLEMRSIVSRNWKRQGYRSPLRPYHKSKGCAGYDQMAHEG